MKEMAKAIETDKELDYEDEQSYLKEYPFYDERP